PPAAHHRPRRHPRRRRGGAARLRGRGVGPVTPRGPARRPRILIIVQNLPVPFDRRVWLECRALVAAGYDVTVVCPQGEGDPVRDVLDGVTLLKYPAYAPGGGAAGFVVEYAYSFLRTALLALRGRRSGR